MNGVIWVTAQTQDSPAQADSSLVSDAQPAAVRNISATERQACARVANCIRALAKLYFSIHPEAILRVYQVLCQLAEGLMTAVCTSHL